MKKPNQRERVLKYIRDFGSITAYESFMDLGITQLATRIWELKRMDYEFTTTWVYRINRYGERVKFYKYELKED